MAIPVVQIGDEPSFCVNLRAEKQVIIENL
jgi:hypothetical protein